MKTLQTNCLVALFLLGFILVTSCSQTEEPMDPEGITAYAAKASLQKSVDENEDDDDCVPPPSGLVSWWDGDAVSGTTAFDIQDENDGTMIGGVGIVPGMVGTAFSFDGWNDYVVVPNSPNLNPTDEITVEAWYKPESFKGIGNNALVDKGYTSHRAPYYQYHLGVTGDQYPHIYAGSFLFIVAIEGRAIPASTGGHAWTPGNWYHLVGTYDGSNVNLYVNGGLVRSQPASGSITDYGKDVYIGRFSNLGRLGRDYLPGTVDEVAIYNRALSPSEITDLYNAGSAGKCKDEDGDGISDDVDECSVSDLSPTVVIDGCDTGVENVVLDDGCTISDLIAECANNARNHGDFMSCVSHLTNELKKAGIITGQEKGAIQSCAAQANIP